MVTERNYRIRYHANGKPSIFEFYLFVNPLQPDCYRFETEVMRLSNAMSNPVDLHIICYHNQKTVTDFIQSQNISCSSLDCRNDIFQKIYQAALSYKAACFQGKRLGHQYMLTMQEMVKGDYRLFDDQIPYEVAKQVGLELDVFMDDYQSDLVKRIYLRDQKIAMEMGVEHTSSLVIFEHSLSGHGVILTQDLTKENILRQLHLILDQSHYSPKRQHQPRLRIVHH